ncbi:hypothetical protein AB0M11_15615 [Streptomyces sp. NPDC051987]|uniref:hypothetical protein n=1 Tax=Streptomyces sp. NPDC051987 TaxID=3155808 RepID=UPI003428F49C
MAEQKSSSALIAPLRNAASAVRHVPGAAVVTKAAEGTLDKIGAVSPRGRRMAVYAGAGVLGAAGLVEWPVALTGAAVAWLTQPRPQHDGDTARPEAAEGHGAYVAMGDAATSAPERPATAAPGPMLAEELPGGWTRPADPTVPTAPAADPAAPPTDPTAPPAAPEASQGAEDPPSADQTPPPTS